MKQFFLRTALLTWVGLAVTSLAHGQSQITFRDSTKKDRPVTQASGSIKQETVAQIILKPNIGVEKPIPSADIIDIAYEVKPEVRPEYRKGTTAETVTAAKAAAGSAARRTALNEAISEYQKVLPKVAGQTEIERHIKYKIASISAQLAGEDKADIKKAIDLLEKFQKENPNGWQIIGAVTTLSQLYMDLGDYDKAAAAFNDLKSKPGLSDEVKGDCDLKRANCLVRAKKHGEAADQLTKILAAMPKTNPKYKELNMMLITCKANTPDKFKEAISDLRKMISAAKEPAEMALAYNTLGDCFLMNNQPKDAAYEYLYVDLIYNNDKTQHVKAVTQLVQVFKELKQMERVKEYSDKLEKLGK